MTDKPWFDTAPYLRPLLNFVQHRLRYHEALGDIPPAELSPEEIVDAVFVEALSRSDRPAAKEIFPWLRKLARRILANRIREFHATWQDVETPMPPSQARAFAVPPQFAHRLAELLPDPSAPIPEDVAARMEFQETLALLLGQLPETWREPFLLLACQGRSPEEVAALEGIPVAEVERRVRLATEYLRARLAEEYEDTGRTPSERILAACETVEPTAEQQSRFGAAAAPERPTLH